MPEMQDKQSRSSQFKQSNRPLQWLAPTNKGTKPSLCSSSFRIKPRYYILCLDLQLWSARPYALIPYCNAPKLALANLVESLAIYSIKLDCGLTSNHPYKIILKVNAREGK